MHKVTCAAIMLPLAAVPALAQANPTQRGTIVNPVPPDVVKEFAPTGTLRAAINYGNPVLVQRSANGSLSGITVDLARELARRLDLPLELVPFETAGKVFEALKADTW